MTTYQKTHELVLLGEKPSAEEIKQLNLIYYEAESQVYDQFNQDTAKRNLFMERVDSIIADKFKYLDVKVLLTVACGTGYRELRIKERSSSVQKIKGVDISSKMCQIASSRGIEMLCGDWARSKVNGKFSNCDATVMLNYIGLSPTSDNTLTEIGAVYQALIPGGYFFVDAYNIEDDSEWGPEIKALYKEKSLDKYGYQLGDVFFKRVNSEHIAFFHYFSTEELKDLCVAKGFRHIDTWYINTSKKPGEVVSKNEGNILMLFQRPE